MKQFFVIFVLVVAFLMQTESRKVCILFEQKAIPALTTVSDRFGDVTIGEISSLDIQEDIVITLGDLAEVTEEIAAITAEAITETQTEEEISESISLASSVTETTPTNVCALEGITLFDDQNDLLRKMCTIKASFSSLYVLTVQNSVVKADLPLTSLCSEGPRGLLSWISWQDFIEKVKPFLDAYEQLPSLVVRNSSIGGPSESDNEADPFSEVLIEMLPISYKLVNMKPSAWNNNTFIRTVSLGDIKLENSNDSARHIEGEINYSFPVETNITFLSHYPISGLPVEMSDDGRRNFIVGSGVSYRFDSTFSVERLVPALSIETVSLNGTFGLHEYDIEGEIVSIFGVNSDGSSIEESHLISARVVSSETYDIKETYTLRDYLSTTTEEAETTTYEELPIAIPHVGGPVYPGFKKFFYVAVFLVFGTLIIALSDVVRKLRQDRIAKREGRRTYQKILPKL